MKATTKRIINYVVLFIIGIAIGYLIHYGIYKNNQSEKVITETIEVPIHDTITIDSIRIKYNTIVRYRDVIDTFYLTNSDTVYITDVPITYYEYKDSIKNDSASAIIDIKHHGFLSEIDNVNLRYTYNRKETVKEKQKTINAVWYFGPTIGYGGFIDLNNNRLNLGHGPYIGISFGIGMGGTIK